MQTTHEHYMSLCLKLAKKGLGKVHPNPMVGSVIVHQDKVIGRGYHKAFGKAHAEVNAINSVQDNELLKKSTLYVNLEPCSHYGKTPPCSDLIIRNEIPRVVIGNVDPFKEVSGRGIQKLRSAGIEVITGILEEKCAELNEAFLKSHAHKRPLITLKYAQSLDGFIATGNLISKWISGIESRTYTHRLRAWNSAIMVGTQTALRDNPSLTVRHVKGRNPIRVLLDRNLEVPLSFNIFNDEAPTLVFTSTLKKEEKTLARYLEKNITVFYVNENTHGLDLADIFTQLYRENIISVLVEGGSQLISSLVKAELCDKFSVFIAPKYIGGDGLSAVQSLGIVNPSEAPQLVFNTYRRFGPDLYVEGNFLWK